MLRQRARRQLLSTSFVKLPNYHWARTYQGYGSRSFFSTATRALFPRSFASIEMPYWLATIDEQHFIRNQPVNLNAGSIAYKVEEIENSEPSDEQAPNSNADLAECEEAAPNSIVRNLVFMGGGPKGLAYVGALLALDAHLGKKGWAEIERIAGASAGAITATLKAVGYTPDEIHDLGAVKK